MPTKEFNNVQLDVTFIQAATRSNIISGEDIATSFGKISKWFTDLKSIAWDGHPTVTQKDTTSAVSPNPEETFTVVDSVTRNDEGHVTGINVKTVKLPTGSGYVHPSHDSHESGLYKITVDELGHVSAATTVTKSDITDLGIPGSDTNTTYTLSGAYGSSSNTWVTTLTPSSGSATTSTVPTASTTAYGITKLSSATDSTSTSLAATASAVKAAYDKANHSHPYLPLAGGTMTGKITCVSSKYTDDYTTGCIDCKNSNIVGLNSLVFADLADTAAEGLQFYRTTTNVDTLWVKNGVIYFSPNRPLGTSSDITTHTVIHSGNLTSYTYSSTASRTANTVLAAPNGSAGAATFRALVTADLPASGATAGSYGPSANASPAHSGTFSVPYITINAKGQVTSASTKTITLPASGNTDTKVTQSKSTTSSYRPILMGYTSSTDTSSLTSTVTNQTYTSLGIYAKPSTGVMYANGLKTIATPVEDDSTPYAGEGITTLDENGYPGLANYKTFLGTTYYDDDIIGIISVRAKNGNGGNYGLYIRANLSLDNPNLIWRKQSLDGSWQSERFVLDSGNAYTTTVPNANGTAATGTASTVSRSDHVHPLQTTVSGNAGTATKWLTGRNINGLTIDGSANRVNYGTCSTAAATAAKVVACSGFALITGAEITVKFTVTNTASSPTLNVNSTGAKAIYYRGSTITAGYLVANRTYTFRYNGTQYDLVGDIDTNTYVTQTSSTTSNYRPLLMGYKNSTDTSTLTEIVTNQAYTALGIYAQPSTGTLYASKYNDYKIGGVSGNWWTSIPAVRSDGVMEVGKYIDFHTTDTGTTDNDVRLTAGSGTLTCSGSITATSFLGNASSASKLATARTITLGGGLRGSTTFDGSADVTLSGSLKRCYIADDSSDWSTYPWRKIASTTLTNTYSDSSITFLVTRSWGGADVGILRARIRAGATKGVYDTGQIAWIFLTDKSETYLKPANFVMVYTNNSGTSLTAEIWVKNTARYNGYMFTVLDQSYRTAFDDNRWTVYSQSTRASAYTSGTGVLVSGVYTLQNSTLTKLLYSGTGLSSSTAISGLSSYDLFTIIVDDGTWEYPIVASPDNYTRYCIPQTPNYQTSSTSTSMLTVGVYVNTSSNTISCASSKYIIQATSTTPTAATHSKTFAIVKVYGHKYYYHS